jgi:hypothetical protein
MAKAKSMVDNDKGVGDGVLYNDVYAVFVDVDTVAAAALCADKDRRASTSFAARHWTKVVCPRPPLSSWHQSHS